MKPTETDGRSVLRMFIDNSLPIGSGSVRGTADHVFLDVRLTQARA